MRRAAAVASSRRRDSVVKGFFPVAAALSAAGWSGSPVPAGASMWQNLDENPADDTDYVESQVADGSAYGTILFRVAAMPVVTTQTVSLQLRGFDPGTSRVDYNTRFSTAAGEIGQFSSTFTGTVATKLHTLTSAQVAAVPDWADFRISMVLHGATAVGSRIRMTQVGVLLS